MTILGSRQIPEDRRLIASTVSVYARPNESRNRLDKVNINILNPPGHCGRAVLTITSKSPYNAAKFYTECAPANVRTEGLSACAGDRRQLSGTVATATVAPRRSKNSTLYPGSL